MFWNKKKKETEKEPEKPDDTILEQIEKLKAFRDIGEKFNYLGVEMMVTGHMELNEYASIYNYNDWVTACLIVDYVTKNGEIKRGKFYLKDLPLLMKENNENN